MNKYIHNASALYVKKKKEEENEKRRAVTHSTTQGESGGKSICSPSHEQGLSELSIKLTKTDRYFDFKHQRWLKQHATGDFTVDKR